VKLRTLLPGLVLLATLVAVGYAIDSGLLGNMLSQDWIDREVRDQGIPGELLYVVVSAVLTAIAVPRHLVSFLGGYAFGVSLGTALALLATELGCVLTFYYARIVGRQLVSAHLGERVRRIEEFLAANPFSMTLLVRLLPVGNNFATSLAAGVSRVPARPFLLGSLLGYLPQTLVFALAGSGVDLGSAPQIAVAALLLVASGMIGAWMYLRYRHGKSLGQEVDGEVDANTET